MNKHFSSWCQSVKLPTHYWMPANWGTFLLCHFKTLVSRLRGLLRIQSIKWSGAKAYSLCFILHISCMIISSRRTEKSSEKKEKELHSKCKSFIRKKDLNANSKRRMGRKRKRDKDPQCINLANAKSFKKPQPALHGSATKQVTRFKLPTLWYQWTSRMLLTNPTVHLPRTKKFFSLPVILRARFRL